jgi:16S rRNA processing protein RimM
VTSDWDDMVLVGRVARPHGLRGDVVVSPDTDFVEERFRRGATMWTMLGTGAEELTVAASRLQGRRPVVRFEGFGGIDEAERLSGCELRVPEDALMPLGPGEFYHHQLVGCAVETVDGARIGEVTRVERAAGGSCLIVEGTEGEIMIPLAVSICVGVDIAARMIRVDPPDGLLDLNARRTDRSR